MNFQTIDNQDRKKQEKRLVHLRVNKNDIKQEVLED
jgi:hypothetical protein